MRDIKKMTREEILAMLCSPGATDEPEESDFERSDDRKEEEFVKKQIEREMS
ncbi:MAG: hypothetical protein LBI74_05825 [Synergistaceae bacterium]|jgi:hypothetical protein|nr:hypothetical protein [Synergistaceae bacterium]